MTVCVNILIDELGDFLCNENYQNKSSNLILHDKIQSLNVFSELRYVKEGKKNSK